MDRQDEGRRLGVGMPGRSGVRDTFVVPVVLAAAAAFAMTLAGCGPSDPPAGSVSEPSAAAVVEPSLPESGPELPASLVDTRWSLVQFQSMDDSIGKLRPDDEDRFFMTLGADGIASMELDCNRATGNWTATASADGQSGSFGFGLLAATRARCPPPNLDERITRDAQYVRGFMLNEGRLHLSLMADGGIYTWHPAPPVPEADQVAGDAP